MEPSFPFDPLARGKEVEALVLKNGRRIYHRFRAAPYYGGIATADAIGCNLLCAYCWNYFKNLNPERFPELYSPAQVASRLLQTARKKSFRLFRITGSEPVLGEASLEHLTEVLQLLLREEPRATFVLETNGLFLGYRPDIIEKLHFPQVRIRICLKGVDQASFEKMSGARGEFLSYPLVALRECQERGLEAWPALMGDFFSDQDISRLKKTLSSYGIREDLELEYLERYPFVLENLERRKTPVVR